MEETCLDILQLNYWEHFKKEKDISLVYAPNHPTRIKLRKDTQEILDKINKLKGNHTKKNNDHAVYRS